MPVALRTALSGRSREVETRVAALELAEGRKLRGGALAVVAKETRAPKAKLDHADVVSWWDAVAGEHGFGRAEVEALRDPVRERPTGDRVVAQAIMRRLAAEGPTVSTPEVRAVALEAAAGRTSPRRAVEILGELQEAGLVIALEDDRVTTKPIRELEAGVLRTARQAARPTAPLDPATIQSGSGRPRSTASGNPTSPIASPQRKPRQSTV